MFTINHDSLCVSFGIINAIDKTSVIKSIGRCIGLEPFKDVVIANEAVNDIEIYNAAKLYVEIVYRPAGVPVTCDICSIKLHEIITDWTVFLKEMAFALNSNIFIDSSNKGYIIKPNGNIERKNYSTEFIDEIECVFIKE